MDVITVRATRHLTGGYAPGYVYEVDTSDPRIARHLENRGLVPHPTVAADEKGEPEGEPSAEATGAPEAPAEELEGTEPEE